jgi:tetratricopeptide (TPR) repeat protein
MVSWGLRLARRDTRWTLLLTIGSLSWAGCSQAPPDFYLAGVGWFDQEEYDKAISDFTEALDHNPMHADAAFRRARAFEKQRNAAAALADYTEAIRIDQELAAAMRLPKENRSEAAKKGVRLGSDLIEAYLARGILYTGMGKNDEAVDDFSRALTLDRNRAEAHRCRGVALLAKDLADLALDDLNTAVQLAPDDAEALYQRAQLLLHMKDGHRAIDDCRRALQLDPKYARAYQALAEAYSKDSPPDYVGAVACYQEAGRLEPKLAREFQGDLANVYFQYGVSLAEAGKKQEAEATFSRATALDPKYAQRVKEYWATVRVPSPDGQTITKNKLIGPAPKVAEFNQQGFDALQHDRWDEAIRCFGEAIGLDPNFADAHFGRGAAFLGKGFPNTAIAEFDRAILSNENYAAAYGYRARACLLLDRCSDAISDATEAIRLNPASALNYCNRAVAYLRDGGFDRALADLNEAVSLNPAFESTLRVTFAQARRGRGLEHLRKGHWDAALVDLVEAVHMAPKFERQLRPQLAEAYRGRGLDYASDGESAKALADLSAAVQLDPASAKNYEARGRTYFQLRQWGRAAADLARALRLDPDDYQAERLLTEAETNARRTGG